MRRNIMKKLLATVCAVAMVVGSMTVSALGAEPLKVTTSYNGNHPTVSANKTDGVSYQWYELEAGEKAEVVYNIVDEAAGKIYVPLEKGIYYENENKWIPEEGMRYMHIYIECKAGDVINVTWLGGVAEDRVTFNNEICVKNGDVYSKTIVDDGIVEVNIRDEATPANVDDYVITFGKWKGTKLVDLYNKDRSYCMWLKENSYQREVVEMIKQIESKQTQEDDEI